MGSREKKGSTEGLEINVKKWWDAGTPAIPERATNVLQMRARRDVRCRSRWSMEPPTISTSRGSEPSWALCSGVVACVGLKSWTMKLLLSLEGQFVLPWERRASGRFRALPAAGQSVPAFPSAHNSGR